MGLGDDRPRSASAKALEETSLEVITEDNFEETVLGNRERLNEYLATLFERLRTTDNLLQMAIKRPASSGPAEPDQTHSMETAMVRDLEVGESEAPGEAVAANYVVTLVSEYEKTGWRGEPINVTIDKFPFRIGRADPRGGTSPFGANDLMIGDGVPYQISRNHCVIERHGNRFVMRDRGSTVGTIVNGQHIGVNHHEIAATLEPGDNTVVFGAEEGPYHFRLRIEPA